MRWFAFRMSGFGGLWVPEQVGGWPTSSHLYRLPVVANTYNIRREGIDGFLCEDEESCERWCDHMNRNQ